MKPSLIPRDSDPEWLAVLRALAASSSINKAATAIGKSRTTVSLVLSGTYPASLDEVEMAVRKQILGRVSCPGLGTDITAEDCADWAAKPFAATSAHRAAMWRACQTCPKRGSHAE